MSQQIEEKPLNRNNISTFVKNIVEKESRKNLEGNLRSLAEHENWQREDARNTTPRMNDKLHKTIAEQREKIAALQTQLNSKQV